MIMFNIYVTELFSRHYIKNFFWWWKYFDEKFRGNTFLIKEPFKEKKTRDSLLDLFFGSMSSEDVPKDVSYKRW